MEGVLLHASAEKPISPYKSHIRNSNKINRPLISRSCDQNFLPSNLSAACGLLQVPPPFLYHSYPSFPLKPPPQPPLLPLPTINPHRATTTTTLSRGLSCPLVNRRAMSYPKKSSKSTTRKPKKEEKNLGKIASGFVTVSSNSPLRPDPKDLPKSITKASSSLSPSNTNRISTNSVGSLKSVETEQIDKFSGSVLFTISPPPSSLPLPTFSLRPKLSCNAQAAGIDTGATDNLRRLLRLP
ncbi:Hypothetical predicted protein [Olea europaea subsp. europaea]|uniref:Uncharacterized protein n=1 Tax=Olea europaea subsp. europaea TaxID=158383 RepID=A0A8S0VCY2_OLEEU|nr:Hypothetical predicted protein [Olea europaea subsp. europaea]